MRTRCSVLVEGGAPLAHEQIREVVAEDVIGLVLRDVAVFALGDPANHGRNIERGWANMQIDTLRRIGRCFGLDVGFVRRAAK